MLTSSHVGAITCCGRFYLNEFEMMPFSHKMKETHNILPEKKKRPFTPWKPGKFTHTLTMSNKIILKNALKRAAKYLAYKNQSFTEHCCPVHRVDEVDLKWPQYSHSAVQAQSFIHLKVIDPTISFTLIVENHLKEAMSPSLLPVLRQQCVGLFMCWSFHNSHFNQVDLLFPASYEANH